MSDLLEDFDLPRDSLDVLLVLDFLLLENLDGNLRTPEHERTYLLPCEDVGGLLDLTESALAERLPYTR
jgi:hypothetical protein